MFSYIYFIFLINYWYEKEKESTENDLSTFVCETLHFNRLIVAKFSELHQKSRWSKNKTGEMNSCFGQ